MPTARDAWIRALQRTSDIEQDMTLTLPALIERLASEHGTSPALCSREASLTYEGLAARCNRYARWGLAQGLKSGDVVALVMPNCAEYPAVWLGLSRIGVAVALINVQLSGEPLAHCIRIAEPRLVIAAAELAPRIAAVRASLPSTLPCWVHGAIALESLSGEPLFAGEFQPPTLDTTALYIYTSGTTGLPKAAHVTHYRVLRWSQWFAGLLDTQPSDRMYNCLPLYHSVGGVVATGATLVGGGSVVIRARFSASDFWSDVARVALHLVPVHRRALPLPRQRARRTPHETRHRCAWPAATGCVPKCGSRSRRGFAFPAFSSTTPRPKATSRSTTARDSRARSAAFRRSSRTRFRSRCCASTSKRRARAQCRGLLHPLRRGTRSARRWA